MTDQVPSPPRWAEALLRSLVRPRDRESIPGDLLEEFRECQRPARGALGANAWYLAQVVSMLWQLVWPAAIVLIAAHVVIGIMITNLPESPIARRLAEGLFYGSPVQAPGISLFDAVVYAAAGGYAAWRTRLVRTGMIAGGSVGFIGLAALFATVAIRMPDLLRAPFEKPFIFVIGTVLLSIALSCSVAAGLVGGLIGRWTPPAADPARAS